MNSTKLRNSSRYRHGVSHSVADQVSDGLYTALLIEKFLRLLMINGQKSKAYKILNKTLSILQTKIQNHQHRELS